MATITTQQLYVLDRLSTQLGIEHRFSAASGDAPSDLFGWLSYALRDANQSAAMVALRQQVKVLTGANITPDAAALFSYFVAQMSGGVPISGYTPLGVAQNAYWWDTQRWALTGSAPNQYVVHDQFARLAVIVPDGTTQLTVEAISTTGAGATLGNTVDSAVGGVAQSLSLQFTTPGVKQSLVLTIPGTGARLVELYEQQCYITGITPQTTATIVPAAPHGTSALFVGASGTEGYFSWDPTNFVGGVLVFLLAWVGRIKTSGRFLASYVIASDGYGLQDYIPSPSAATCAAFVAATVAPRCTGGVQQTIVYEFGAGDYFHGVWNAAQITSFYGMLADATHAALPNARIFFKTLVVMSSPAEGTVSASGCTQQQMRDAIAAVAVGRPWVTITTGYNAGKPGAETDSTSDLQDGKHLTPVAHRDKAYPYMRSVL